MKNAFQKATKILIAILITSVASCQNDDDQSVSIAAVKSKNIQTINIEQLKPKIINNEILLNKLSRNFKKKNYRRTENGYAFDLDSIKQYENGNYSSYTVSAEKIVPDSSNYIYKLLIEENQDTIKTSMLTFDLKDGNLVPIVKEDFTSNTPAKLECITVTVVTDCTCHTHGSASCTHPTYTTVSSCSGGSSNPGNGQTGGTPTTTPTNPSGSGVNPVIVIDQEDAWIRFNSFKSRLTTSQKNWLNDNPETHNEIFSYLWSKGFSGSSQAETKNIIEKYRDINNKMIIISPNIPIYDMDEYLKCFDLTKSATVTIFVDQPIANSNLVISSEGVGHTFIGISQQSNRSVFGFYPSGTASPINPSDFGIMGNDASHAFDVAISINISASVLQQIINLSKSYGNYNLNSHNCSDFGIEIANLCNMNFPDCSSTWGIGSGSNPAKLGQHIRNNYPINGYYDVNKNGGTAPPNNKNCN